MAAALGYVFVSYAREDTDVVVALVKALEDRGILFRFERDLEAGAQWREKLSEWLEGAGAVFVVWSSSSASSAWVVGEASRARERLVPVTITGMSIVPGPFQDLMTIDLSAWAGDPGDSRLDQVAQALRDKLSAHPAPGASSGVSGQASIQPAVSPATDPDQALAAARSIADAAARSRGLIDAAGALVDADPNRARSMVDEALASALSITDPAARSSVLAEIAQVMSRIDPDQARSVVDQALAAARSITDPAARSSVLAEIAQVMSRIDPDQAGPVVDQALADASSITDEAGRAHVLSVLAQVLSVTDPERAKALSDEALKGPGVAADGDQEISPGQHDEAEAVQQEVAGTGPQTSAERQTLDGSTQALQEASVPTEQAIYTREPVGRDYYTTIDSAGYAAYADAITRAIQHKDTKPPLTIGIKGSWGAGKTSLMRMVQDRLEWPAGEHPADKKQEPGSGTQATPLRSVYLTQKGRELTFLNTQANTDPSPGRAQDGNANLASDQVRNRTVLRALKALPDRQDDEPKKIKADPSPLPAENSVAGWRPTVWFNPWMYQTGEQVWAGLAYEIIKQITSRMSVAEREHFWLRLNLKRVDHETVRRKIYSIIVDRILPFAAAAVIVIVVGLVLLLTGIPAWVTALLAGGAPVAVGLAAVTQITGVLNSRVTGSVAELVKPATAAKQFTAEAFRGAYGEIVESPDYSSKTGFFYLVRADVQRVLDLVASEERPLVVFIDDLDRCSPGTVVQVIEALNLFLAGEYPNAIFVVAMEPEMVAAHIEVAYLDLAKALSDTGIADQEKANLGWKFLEKIVQLPLTLPAMEQGQMESYFKSLFPDTGASPGEQRPDASGPEVQAKVRELAGTPLTAAVRMSRDLTGTSGADSASDVSVQAQALRQVVDQQLSFENDDVKKIITQFASSLDANPREIKRFVNVFRFLVMIDSERSLQNLRSIGNLDAIAKLAVLHIRWPEAITVLARQSQASNQRTVYEFIEDPESSSAGNEQATSEDPSYTVAQSELAALAERFKDPDLRTFIGSPPKIGDVARYYL